MLRPLGLVVLTLALALDVGCSRATRMEGKREMVHQGFTTLTVRVVNRSQLDAIIYLVHDGTRDRLGTATAASVATFSVPGRQLGSGEFMLLADPVGGRRTASTEGLRVAQGSVFTWTLETDFSRSSVLVQE